MLGAFTTIEAFDQALERVNSGIFGQNPVNFEVKNLSRKRVEATLSPRVVTDRDAVLTFDDATAPYRWGLWFHGPQYTALFARWFDDLWASIPDTQSHLLPQRREPGGDRPHPQRA